MKKLLVLLMVVLVIGCNQQSEETAEVTDEAAVGSDTEVVQPQPVIEDPIVKEGTKEATDGSDDE